MIIVIIENKTSQTFHNKLMEEKMKYNFTNNNTITVSQRDYKGKDRKFNYQTGYRFIPLQTTMMIADDATLATGILSGQGFLYLGCSDTISMADLKTICAFSDQAEVAKKLQKLSPRKRKKFERQLSKSYNDTYNIGMNEFIKWCVSNGLTQAMIKHFLDKSEKDIAEGMGGEVTDADWAYLTEVFFCMETGAEGLNPHLFNLATLNPVRNFEGMTDARLMFFLDNIKTNRPTLLCVVYSEKENYYGLDDINYYEFSYLPNAITSVIHPHQQDTVPMWLSHLKQRLNGAILRVESNKPSQNGQDIQIVTDVLDYCNGYVHLVAHHQDKGYDGIKIQNGNGEVFQAPKNQYRWWVPLDQAVAQGSTLSLLTADFGSKPMDVAFLSELARDEMMRSASIITALLPCGKNRSKSKIELWGGDAKSRMPEVRK
jgi:hypothetical protein